MRETCWRCRPGFSPATGPRRSAEGLLAEPTDVGLSCSSVPLAWGSSCRAWRWNLEDDTQADMLRLHCNAGRCFCVSIPICSFSKGSSISFRLASRRMSVQIYRQIKNHAHRHKWPQEGSISLSAASAVHLVNGGSQTGQAGQAVDVHLTAVRLSSHQVGPVT